MDRQLRKRREERQIIENLLITDAGSEGKAVAKHNGMVVFIPFGAPGDTADVEITFKRRHYAEGKIINLLSASPFRVTPFCSHYGLCGGCRWQHLSYRQQLSAKQKHVIDNLERIGKIKDIPHSTIIPADNDTFYRNKLEFTFADRRWLTTEEIKQNIEYNDQRSLGFHIPDRFDKIIDIEKCYLQPEPSNKIRNLTKQFAFEHNLEFFNLRDKKGLLRNLIIRNNAKGEFMVILVMVEEMPDIIDDYTDFITKEVPEISSLYIAINNKPNDSLDGVPFLHVWGNDYLEEQMDDLVFRITPASFFQTNTTQAIKLYKAALDMVKFTGKETVYDLYTGTATIAAMLSKKANKVIGIEYSEAAIQDGIRNLQLNNIDNVELFHGDMGKIFDFNFAKKKGFPDIIFTDPPRSGMVPSVVANILEIQPREIVYISCNSATQARDLAEMTKFYNVVNVQPVDMFPHTHHVENIVHLVKK